LNIDFKNRIRILDKAQTVEGNANLDSYFDHQDFSTPSQHHEQSPEPDLLSVMKVRPQESSQVMSEEVSRERLASEVINPGDEKSKLQRNLTF
jgi:hypothetical protein